MLINTSMNRGVNESRLVKRAKFTFDHTRKGANNRRRFHDYNRRTMISMSTDEQAIRDLVAGWHKATAEGDVDTILGFMAEDAIFLVAGQPPMRGRAAFEQNLRAVLTQHRIESKGEVLEVEVSGSLAYSWASLTVRVMPLSGGAATVRTGSTLSIFRKQANGSWVLIRDANLLSAES